MKAAILSIGDELTLGQTQDTNSHWLSARLAEEGVMTALHLTVPDDKAAIVEAIRYAADRTGLVIVTGGLGPTDDDLTRQAVADLLGKPLELHAAALEQIEAYFRKISRPMRERNKVQAMCPAGAVVLENPVGTAPGIYCPYRDYHLFCVPGVPGEMRKLYEMHVLPFLRRHTANSPRVILTAKLNVFGTGESVIADMLAELMDRTRNPLVGTTVSQGIISVRIRSESTHRALALGALDETVAQVRARLGSYVFGAEEQTLGDAVGALLAKSGKTVVTAESCTGGLLGKMLTDVSGSSAYYLGGWIVYSNEAKRRDLGVPGELIERHGAVSEPVAAALAEGARGRANADYALAITGVAGPTGGTAEKPVGTVWIALSERGKPVHTLPFVFPGNRQDIRDRAAKTALNELRLRLGGYAQSPVG